MENIIDLFNNATELQKKVFIETLIQYAGIAGMEHMLLFLLDKDNGDYFKSLFDFKP